MKLVSELLNQIISEIDGWDSMSETERELYKRAFTTGLIVGLNKGREK